MARALLCAGLVAVASASLAQADRRWARCGNALLLPERPLVSRAEAPPGTIQMQADEADLQDQAISILSGDVEVIKDDQLLLADRARYDRVTEVMEADGNVRYWEGTQYVTGDTARLDTRSDELRLDEATYMEIEAHERATARTLKITGSDLIEAENATYTTCNPDSAAWILKAGELRLDKVRDVGTARNVTVRFYGVPIFYSPYLTFPLSSARKSGFLVPSFRASGQAGAEFTVPYYFNIAPNQDATLRIRTTTQRGPLLGGEYRYLTRRGEGEMEVELLPNDRDDGGTRGQGRLYHTGSFAPRWSTLIDYSQVSDREYFEDFGNDLSIASTTHLLQLGQVGYSASRWYAIGQVLKYQTVDRTIPGPSRPYQLLPRLQLAMPLTARNRRLNFGAFAGLDNFDRKSSVTGQRFDVRPTISYPVRTAGAFVEPRLSVRYTVYNLDGRKPAESDRPSRVIPTLSVDSGLFLERDVKLRGRDYVHTIEPRLYYLFVPFDRQDELPVFDTGQFSFNFAQLFRTDRFSGGDRVGDANQVTIALTSRILDASSGGERFRASIGQIRYFRDRKVTLPGTAAGRDGSSDIVAEVAANVARRWRMTGGIQWNTQEASTNKNTVSLRYQPGPDRVVNLAYRFVRDAAEQMDVSTRWPVTTGWSVVGRFNYAIPERQILEGLAGVEYDSCCWAARAVFRRFLNRSGGEATNSIFLQLELKGLAGVGRKAEALLEQSIPGFRNQF